MTAPHIHTPKDGRGLRDVFVNGRLVNQVFYADTKRGVVRAYRIPLRLDKWRKRVLSVTLHGYIDVREKVGAGDTAVQGDMLLPANVRSEPPSRLLAKVGSTDGLEG